MPRKNLSGSKFSIIPYGLNVLKLEMSNFSLLLNPPGTKRFGTHTKHQGGGGSKRTPPVSQEREMLQT